MKIVTSYFSELKEVLDLNRKHATLNTQWCSWGQTLASIYILPDIDALLVDFTGIGWQHPGQ